MQFIFCKYLFEILFSFFSKFYAMAYKIKIYLNITFVTDNTESWGNILILVHCHIVVKSGKQTIPTMKENKV